MINPEPNTDAELERAIDFQRGLVVTAISREEKLAACQEMARLIALRSPAQIARMEREILR